MRFEVRAGTRATVCRWEWNQGVGWCSWEGSYTDTSQCESGRIGLWFSEELEEWRVVPKAPLQVPWASTKALDFCGEIKKGWLGSCAFLLWGWAGIQSRWPQGGGRESSRDRGCDWDLGLVPHLR